MRQSVRVNKPGAAFVPAQALTSGVSLTTAIGIAIASLGGNAHVNPLSVAAACQAGIVTANQTEAFDYRKWGCPYLTDMLPSGLMPTLPTPNSQAGWPYDPILRVAPTPEEHWPDPNQAITGSYYVDNTHPSATDTGNPYGSRNTPRLTGPGDNVTLPAGSVIYMVGGGAWYRNESDRIWWHSEGTAENPCWLLGVNGPTFTRPLSDNRCSIGVTGTHFIARDVRLEIESTQQQVQFHIGNSTWGPGAAQYICFQNIEATNNGAAAANGAGVVSVAGDAAGQERTEFVVIYQCDFHDNGLWETNPSQLDHHAIRPSTWCSYIWIIECNLVRAGGDSCQIGVSNNNDPTAATRAHYVWLYGNEMSQNFENSLDTKNCYHVFLGKNNIHNFYNASFPANNTAVLINNEEGAFAGYKWIIANRIYDFGGPGIRDSGDHDDEKNYFFNNLIYDADGTGATGINKANAGINTESWAAHNTIYACPNQTISAAQTGQGVAHHIKNNIFHTCGDATTSSAYAVKEFHNNIWYNSGTISNDFNQIGNLTTDPLLNDPINGDMRIQSGSPALGAAPQLAFWDDFESLYGLDVRYDFDGNPRPAAGQGNHTIGAYEVAI